MKNNSRKKAVTWLSQSGYYIYVDGMTSLLFFPFNQETVKYFDIIDDIKFTGLLDSFLKQNKVESVDSYFIIGQDAMNEGEFVKGNENAVTQFIDNIPYEQVFSKITTNEKSIHVAGFNAAFYQALNSILEKNNSRVLSVFPYFLLSQTKIDSGNAPSILKKAESLKEGNMISAAGFEGENIEASSSENKPKQKEKSTLPFLIPVFILLVGVLIFLLLKYK